MVEPIFDYQFRLILIGDSTVGKSSLLKYFTDGKFAEVITFFSLFFSLSLSLSLLLSHTQTHIATRFFHGAIKIRVRYM